MRPLARTPGVVAASLTVLLLAWPCDAGPQQRVPASSGPDKRDHPVSVTPASGVRSTANPTADDASTAGLGRTAAIAAQSEAHRGGGGAMTAVLALIVLVGVAATVLAWMRAGPRGARIERAGDAARDDPRAQAREDAARDVSVAPPDPERPWDGEIQWRDTPDGPRFMLVANAHDGSDPVVLTWSDPLDWPPQGPASIEALRDTVQRLASAATQAGWTRAPAGRAWYAERFTWQPPTRGLSTGRFKKRRSAARHAARASDD